ncbi:MAG: indole-3-glycerol phosphate synthase TrpC [Bacteroidales bacterium]|nr:indole-3-glycerol phosphate synthase TrpC [Bacteroidales bacterium]
MENILHKIIAHKKREIERRKLMISIHQLEKSAHFNRFTHSFSDYIKHKSGIIAEHKRRSPSKGWIRKDSNLSDICTSYVQAGASAISILTESEFFGGSNHDLEGVRKKISIPILRKDFIVDPYQIIESKAIGADTILLIASCLNKTEVKELAIMANALDMEVLIEIHNADELDKLNDYIQLVGVNNRNLKSFEVDISNSITLAKQIPDAMIKISESGISNAKTILELKNWGFQGFLIGERFMKADNPGMACKNLIDRI